MIILSIAGLNQDGCPVGQEQLPVGRRLQLRIQFAVCARTNANNLRPYDAIRAEGHNTDASQASGLLLAAAALLSLAAGLVAAPTGLRTGAA